MPVHDSRSAGGSVALPSGGMPIYDDRYGGAYSTQRRPDPRLAAVLRDALGDAATVVNVGAGSGSYEPMDRAVVAVEPSSVMRSQRGPTSAPVVDAVAEALPFADDAFDAALAVLTLHHWGDADRGLAELRRVARRRVLVLTWDPEPPEPHWLKAEYLPHIRDRDLRAFPAVDSVARALGGRSSVGAWNVPADCVDGFLGAYWARPEAYLEPAVRAGISSFADDPSGRYAEGLARLAADLESGAWDRRWGHLRSAPELDVGYRIVISEY